MTDDLPWVEKFRPKNLNDVVGQEEIVAKLKGYVADYHAGKSTMPHLLFTGPPGVGKTSIAHALARELYGDNWRAVTLDSNASIERGIDVVRGRIKDFAKTTSIGERFSLIVLDEADSLTADAQSALRRVMEDYSKNTRFIIACNYSRKIIAPIQDRCAVYQFAPLTPEVVSGTLTQIAQKENVEYQKGAMELIARKTGGSLRKAVTLLQSLASVGQITLDKVEAGSITDYHSIVANVIKDNLGDAEKTLIKAFKNGVSTDEMFEGLFEVIDKSSLAEKAKNKILFRLGDYEFRVISGANPTLQLRCFLRELSSMRSG